MLLRCLPKIPEGAVDRAVGEELRLSLGGIPSELRGGGEIPPNTVSTHPRVSARCYQRSVVLSSKLCFCVIIINLLKLSELQDNSGKTCCLSLSVYCNHLLVPPVIKGASSDLPEEVTVLTNRSGRMECLPSGSPVPRISWHKDGQPLPLDDRHKFLSNGRILQVKVKIHY